MLTSRSSVTNFTGTNPGDENLCFFFKSPGLKTVLNKHREDGGCVICNQDGNFILYAFGLFVSSTGAQW